MFTRTKPPEAEQRQNILKKKYKWVYVSFERPDVYQRMGKNENGFSKMTATTATNLTFDI